MGVVDGGGDVGVDVSGEARKKIGQRPVGGEKGFPSEGDFGVDGLGKILVEIDGAERRRFVVTVALSRALIL